MKKILVTTDFSANSKAGIRFAIQMAAQTNCALTFFNCYSVMRPSSWSDAVYHTFEQAEHEKLKKKLIRFVNRVYKDMDMTPSNVDYQLENSFLSEKTVMNYAAKHKMDFICISRRGLGNTSKLFGGHTSNLIKQSPIPVIAVPPTYRRKSVDHVVYASDFSNLKKELKQVGELTDALGAQLEVLHFALPSDASSDQKALQRTITQLHDNNIKVSVENYDFSYTLIEHLNKVLGRKKPSLFVMFTKQERTLFEKLFLSSISAEYAGLIKSPMLIYRK